MEKSVLLLEEEGKYSQLPINATIDIIVFRGYAFIESKVIRDHISLELNQSVHSACIL